ncbi:MAG: rane protein [Pedobacter sp.]|jgi:outer membrane protein OmpA-like peptidoglycan-associated protein|nr:rane protein [Pedobacter sp.]
MANVHNQPKSNNWIIWLIVILILILIGFYFFSHRNTEVTAEAASDSSTIESTINNNWTGVEDVPEQNYDGLNDAETSTRGNDQYAVYSVDETVLFDVGKSTIKPGAENRLKSIVGSAEKRFPKGDIRIYGYTDSTGNAAENKSLAQSRAEAVRDWMLKNGNIQASRITINPVGEQRPVASNATDAGRKKNRRVEIAVRKKQ